MAQNTCNVVKLLLSANTDTSKAESQSAIKVEKNSLTQQPASYQAKGAAVFALSAIAYDPLSPPSAALVNLGMSHCGALAARTAGKIVAS